MGLSRGILGLSLGRVLPGEDMHEDRVNTGQAVASTGLRQHAAVHLNNLDSEWPLPPDGGTDFFSPVKKKWPVDGLPGLVLSGLQMDKYQNIFKIADLNKETQSASDVTRHPRS